MSNLSGIGDNKTYRGNLPPREPYYYIRATLNLTGQNALDKVFYFNKDNTLEYLNTSKTAYPNPDSYRGYHMIQDNAVIGEVNAFSNPDFSVSGQQTNLVASAAQILSVERYNDTNAKYASVELDADAQATYGLHIGDFIQVSGVTNDANSFNTSGFVQITDVAGDFFEYVSPGNVYPQTSATGSGRKVTGLPSIVLVPAAQITDVERDAIGVATLTLANPVNSYGLVTGDKIKVSGIDNDGGSFNTGESYVEITSTSGSTLTYNSAGAVVATVAATGANRSIQTQLAIEVGGLYRPGSGLKLLQKWGGPTGNTPEQLSVQQVQQGQICYFGQEPDSNFLPDVGAQKFLGVRISGGGSNNIISGGNISVLVKVYPKF